jgi:leucyl aminopeptidase
MDKHHWVYSNDRRTLIVQHDSTDKDIKKHMRELGSLTCQKLQAKKAADVEILCSSKVATENLGTFYNSFLLTNYEWTMKSNLEEKSEEKKEEQTDERLKRKSKVIDSIVLAHENEMHSDFKTHEVFAKSTVFARNLANIRGSHATPCFME